MVTSPNFFRVNLTISAHICALLVGLLSFGLTTQEEDVQVLVPDGVASVNALARKYSIKLTNLATCRLLLARELPSAWLLRRLGHVFGQYALVQVL